MDQERIEKIEEIIKEFLLDNKNNTDYELKKIDVITKYLIYQQLKEINNSLNDIKNNLSLIDEVISYSK